MSETAVVREPPAPLPEQGQGQGQGPPEVEPRSQASQLEEVFEDTRRNIIGLLQTYPYISPTMIQVGIGPACPPKLWRPVLDQMIQEGTILKQEAPVQTPKGRSIIRQIYHLATMPYPPST